MDWNDLLNMPFDQYQRYRFVAELIQQLKAGAQQLRILELGSNEQMNLGKFLSRDTIFYMDLVYRNLNRECKENNLLIVGDATFAPFRDSAFDVVVSLDVFEHVASDKRISFLSEMVRLSKGCCILGCPFNSEGVAPQERLMNEYFKELSGVDHPWLKEHIGNKLPELEWTVDQLGKSGMIVQSFDNAYLPRFIKMMRVHLFVASGRVVVPIHDYENTNYFYNSIFYDYDNKKPSYRKILVFSPLRSALNSAVKNEDEYSRKSEEVLDQLIGSVHQANEIHRKDLAIQEQAVEIQKQTLEIQALSGRLNLIEHSKVWRVAEFLRYLVYTRMLGRFRLIQRGVSTIRKDGFWRFLSRTRDHFRRSRRTAVEGLTEKDYKKWVRKTKLTNKGIREIRKHIGQFQCKPKISIIMPVCDGEQLWLQRAIDSVLNQIYENWELCIVDDGSSKEYIKKTLERYSKKDGRIKIKYLGTNQGISGASNEALSLAAGDFIGLVDSDDQLAIDALYENVKLLNQFPEADMIYSDEDKLDLNGARCEPHFKPDWAPDTLMSLPYTGHFGVYRKSLIHQIGEFRKGYDGSRDSDLVLRISEKTRNIFHIPKILYHLRKISGAISSGISSKSYSYDSASKALTDYLERNHIEGAVFEGHFIGSYRIRRAIKDMPKVKIIVPFKDQAEILEKCVNSIIEKTTYGNFEIHLINNQSEKNETLQYLEGMKGDSICKLWNYNKPFNFSSIINYAVSKVDAEYLVLLNNDMEVISPDWISAMLEFAQRTDVGAVGALLYYPNDTIQHAGVIVGLGGVADHSHRYFPRNALGYMGRPKSIQNLSAVTAACLMTKRKVFEEVGGFDENYSHAFNDVDYCLKIRERGYLIVYTPYAELYHYESLSRGFEDTPEKQARFKKEIEYFQSKWKDVLAKGDPYYSPNLTLERTDFSIRI
jgi:GT2 family glycosyltransferase